MKSTRERILEAAEVVFLEKGYAAASVRDITQRAQVNVAAVNYHFGTKEDLVLALIRSYTDEINLKRIEELSQLDAEGPIKERIHRVVKVLIAPVLNMICSKGHGKGGILLLYGRILAEGNEMRERIDADAFGDFFRAICDSVSRIFEVSDPQKVHMIAHLMMSSVGGVMLHAPRVSAFSPPEYMIQDSSKITEYLERYICGGIYEILDR